jgi:hypothetical protein
VAQRAATADAAGVGGAVRRCPECSTGILTGFAIGLGLIVRLITPGPAVFFLGYRRFQQVYASRTGTLMSEASPAKLRREARAQTSAGPQVAELTPGPRLAGSFEDVPVRPKGV